MDLTIGETDGQSVSRATASMSKSNESNDTKLCTSVSNKLFCIHVKFVVAKISVFSFIE